MTRDEIIQMALEVGLKLSDSVEQPAQQEPVDWEAVAADQAMTIAMMKAEQEPVAHTLNCVCGAMWDIKADGGEEMVFTPDAQPRQPLTDEEIEDIWNRYCDELGEASINDALDIARAIEAAHGITKEKT